MERYFTVKDLMNRQDNIFMLDNPEDTSCRVYGYVMGHSELTVRLYNKINNAELFLVFINVMYYEGRFWWHGANFHLAPQEEFYRYLIFAESDTASTDLAKTVSQSVTETNSVSKGLYLVNSGDVTIKILASYVLLTDDIEKIVSKT